METEFTDVNRFDIVYSYFGLNWINDLNFTVASINRSLKEGGLLLAFATAETTIIDDIETQYIEHSHWKKPLFEKGYVQSQFPTF